ncbi:cytoplasmic protein [candidate division WOR-3 bacterium]|uniref:Cytoplasmic protein n=1 Tax=candidate division WOR-3 bacterium TaxID=2052148 RepID=A0A9D5K773_UNCW3|nr:cytoplasmic protein [candidate division WOR-3 bacterium]MBD3363603.1 cytoplasmic protein [candidate division WOR-3 bacterium]
MAKKIALFAFNGDVTCFVHVLLNALEMNQKGYDVKIVMEGAAMRLISELADSAKPLSNLYRQVKEMGLIDCVCNACAAKTGALEAATEQWLPLCEEMSGHASMTKYLEQGYVIITF